MYIPPTVEQTTSKGVIINLIALLHQGVSGLMAQVPLQPKTPQELWSKVTIENVRARISEMLN
jgi:hypothetical protein